MYTLLATCRRLCAQVRFDRARRRQRRSRDRATGGGIRRARRAARARAARRHVRERRLRAEESHVERGRARGRVRARERLRLRRTRRGPRLGAAQGRPRRIRAALERHLSAQPRPQGDRDDPLGRTLQRSARDRRCERRRLRGRARRDRDRRPSERAVDCAGAELGITSDGFFDLERRPRRVGVVGSGYVAVELGGVLNALGTETVAVRARRTRAARFRRAACPTSSRSRCARPGSSS